MKIWENSLSYRLFSPAWSWLSRAGQASLVGRFVLALGKRVSRVAGASASFGAQGICSYPLEQIAAREALPRRAEQGAGPLASLFAVAWVYAHLRSVLGGGPLGRALRGLIRSAQASSFSSGRWIQVAGAGVLGLCVSLAGRAWGNWGDVAALVPVALAGLLLVVWGPYLRAAWRDKVRAGAEKERAEAHPGQAAAHPARAGAHPARTEAHPARAEANLTWPLGSAIFLSAIAGTLVGQVDRAAATYVVAAFVALGLLTLVLARPAVILLAIAAFPWLDWAARKVMGGLGAGWDEALILGCLLVILWAVLVLRSWDLWTVPIMLPLLAALAAGMGSVVVREVPTDVGLYALRVLFQPLAFYFVGFLLPKSRAWVRTATAVFLVAGCALALHGLYQYLTHAPMPAKWIDVRETDISTRAYSIVENPNGLGAFLIMGVLLSLGLVLSSKLRPAVRGLAAACAVVQVAGVAVTFSRGAWLGLMAGVIALLLLAYRRYLVALLAAAVVGWFVVPQTFVNRLAFAFSRAYIAKSLVAGRLYVWKLALGHTTAHPWFGIGLGTFGGTTAVTFGYGRLWVDNFYLQLAAEGGLILLFCFLWMLLRNARALVRGYEVAQDPFIRALSAGVFAACLGVAVANFTASVWETLVVGVGFWFMAGLATSSALHEEAMSR